MDSAELRSFTAVVDRGGFRRAAEHLGLPQPTVTAHVQRLETELGSLVFDRSRRPVVLTAAGEVFVRSARRILDLHEDALREVVDLRQSGYNTLAVGFMHYLSHLDGPRAIAAFRERWPRMSLNVRVGTTGDLLDLLRGGEVDIAFVHRTVDAERAPAIALTPLRRERLVIVTAAGDSHGLVDRPSLSALAHVPVVRFRSGAATQMLVDERMRDLGLVPQTQIECADMASAVACVRLGIAVAVVPETFASQVGSGLVSIHLQDVELEVELCAARLADRYATSAARNFVNVFTDGTWQPAGPP